MPFDMQPVDSSNLSEAGYDPDSQTMRVRFKSGKVFEYVGCPGQMYQAFLDSPSKGAYHANIIKVGCPARPVPDESDPSGLPPQPQLP